MEFSMLTGLILLLTIMIYCGFKLVSAMDSQDDGLLLSIFCFIIGCVLSAAFGIWFIIPYVHIMVFLFGEMFSFFITSVLILIFLYIKILGSFDTEIKTIKTFDGTKTKICYRNFFLKKKYKWIETLEDRHESMHW